MAGAGLAWKLLGTGGAVVSGVAARKIAHATWKVATGKEPPVNPEGPDASMRESIAWAVASGVTVALVRLFVLKQTAQFWRRSTGKLPPNLHSAKV